jgi:phosphoglycerate kinase
MNYCIFEKNKKPMRTLQNLDFKNQRAVIRVDFNVPLNENLEVTDRTRIEAAKPTIEYILSQGGSCVLLSHLGRPKGNDPKLSLVTIVETVSNVLGVPVQFCKDSVGANAVAQAETLDPGAVLLMENLRFHEEETQGDLVYAEQLSKLGSIYVNDAFGTAHRAHASTTIMAQFFGENKCFGNLLEKEVVAIERVMKNGEKPILAILGGAKVSSKITIIESLLEKVNHLIIGGGMVYTFTKALGGKVGNSICEPDYCDYALELLEKAKAKGVQIHLPVDVLAGDDFSNDANQKVFDVMEIPDGWEALDAGPKSQEQFHDLIIQCKTILWNGPLGVFEFSNFAKGTIAAGESIGLATKHGAFSLVGGGDSVAAVKQFGLETKMSYISTGGGAMLESLEGKTLPGIAALD